MHPRTIRSAVIAVTLVAGVLSASTAQATEPGDATAPSAGQSSRAAGLIVTTRASERTLEKAADAALDGAATIDDIDAFSSTQQVIRFDDSVSSKDAELIADRLGARSDVVAVEPDYLLAAADAPPVQVNDPLFGQQAHLWDTSRAGGGFSAKAPAFWTRTFGSPGVRVAVLDTGMTAHPDLTWAGGRDIVGNDNDPTDPGGDNDFHGTHVAGIVAARANNGIGGSGVAPGVTLESVRVLDETGEGAISDIALGIYWAAGFTVQGSTNPAPVQVINMSLSGRPSSPLASTACSSTLADAVSAARSRGVVVVAAAGNSNRDAVDYSPANCPGVIAVGAVDGNGARASFSNFGSTVDISAPGVGVVSTVSLGGGSYGYQMESGTSMASPVVAGAAALMFSIGMSAGQVEAALPSSVQSASTPGTAAVLDLSRYFVAPQSVPSTRVSMKATKKVLKGKRASVKIKLLSSTGAKPYGRIRVFDGKKIVRTATVSVNRRGSITVRTPRLKRKGVHRIKVVFLGGGAFRDSRSVTRTVTVR